jgi:UDP-N-acetylglucosamine 2-epimerase (non-hydrolysing)
LIKGGARSETVHVTGNTVIDALFWGLDRMGERIPDGVDGSLLGAMEGKRLVLVTSHRRESFGEGLRNICQALVETARRHSDIVIIYPVHLNPNVVETVRKMIGVEPRVHLIEPIGYLEVLYLMKKSYFILTDSGGVQEEGPSLGKPVLIMRETTERPEAVEAGTARLVGTKVDGIVRAASELLDNPRVYERMAKAKNPFGDGQAAKRIVELLSCYSPAK